MDMGVLYRVIGASRFDFDAFAGRRFYFRFFNASSFGDATEAGLIYNTNGNWVTPDSSPTAFPYEAQIGRTGSQSAELDGSTAGERLDGWATMQWLEDDAYTTNNVPIWWLTQHALTNRDWAIEALDDQDGDGLPTWQEHRASTDPNDSNSVFEISEIGVDAGTDYVKWYSTGVDPDLPPFEVHVTTNLAAPGGGWQPAVPCEVPRPEGQGTNTWFGETPDSTGRALYRIIAP